MIDLEGLMRDLKDAGCPVMEKRKPGGISSFMANTTSAHFAGADFSVFDDGEVDWRGEIDWKVINILRRHLHPEPNPEV